MVRFVSMAALACAVCTICACGGGGGGGPDGGGGDPDACVPISDEQLCLAQTAECGNIAAQDGCNPERIINCGTCTLPEMCTFGGSCCADTGDLCARYGWLCGTHTVNDYCFVQQTVDCGGCAGGLACGDHGYCGVCLGGFVRTSFVPASVIGERDLFLGASSDGASLLLLRPEDAKLCDPPFRLHIADGSLGMYDSIVDITMMGSLASVTKDPASLFLAGDGLTIVAVTSDGVTLGETRRASSAVTAFGPFDTTPYAMINASLAMTPGAVAGSPVVSANRLFLTYSVTGAGPGLDGIYEASRPATDMPFGPGTRLGPEVQAYLGASGLSDDGLRIYLLADATVGTSVILTRADVDQPFGNPWAPDPPPGVPGFRVVPLEPCILIGNWQVDGCLGEEIVLFEAPL